MASKNADFSHSRRYQWIEMEVEKEIPRCSMVLVYFPT